MDLTQGLCILCKNNTKIILPPQAEDATCILKDILEDQIDPKKFNKVNSLLKVCPMCIHDLLTVADLKQKIKGYSEDLESCALCYSEEHLVSITNWTSFKKKVENIQSQQILGSCSACLNCIKCLDLLERIKTNLFDRYPHLKYSDSVEDKTHPKEKNRVKTNSKRQRPRSSSRIVMSSDEESDYSFQGKTKSVNNLKRALKHLKPLKHTQFDTYKFKEDKKLFKQIAFVKLSMSEFPMKDRKLERRSKTSVKSNYISDTDTSRDSPIPKQSFFKIKLKVNPNKIRTQRVTHGKVTKPKGHKNKIVTEDKKELIVKIIKMNLDSNGMTGSDRECQMKPYSPTKASRKMMPDDNGSSSKKRKSVTFADVLDIGVGDNLRRNDDKEVTPLKSLLKKNNSSKSDLLEEGFGGSSDESDSDNKTRKVAERNFDSDEEFTTAKGYVEDILNNRDDIFDSLKTSSDVGAQSTKLEQKRGQSFIDSGSDSGDEGNAKLKEGKSNEQKSKERSLKERQNDQSLEINSDNPEKEKDTATAENESNGVEIKENSTFSTENGESARAKLKAEISLLKCLRDVKESDETSSLTSLEDQEVTFEEFKKLKDSDLSKNKGSEKRKGKSNEDEDTTVETAILGNGETTEVMDMEEDKVDIGDSTQKEDGNKEIDNKEMLDISSDSESNSNSKCHDSSNLRSKPRKRSESIIKEENEEALNISRDSENSEESETKKQKVSEVDDEVRSDEEVRQTPTEDMVIPEKREDADDKMDELIARYTKPSSLKLNKENNVSDMQNVVAGCDDQELSSSECEDVGEDVEQNIIVKNNSKCGMTADEAPENCDDTLKRLDLDNIMENIVDSC